MENMSGTEAKRAKKRRNKKTSKSITNSATNFPDQQTPVTSSGASNFHPELQRIIDEVSDEPFGSGLSPLGPNPYLDVDKCLGVERCLLCRCERPHSATLDNIDGEDDMSRSENGSLAQLPLWVCPECRRTVEEEEKRAAESALLKPDLRMDGPLPLMSELGGAEPTTANGTVCTCEACTERRQIEAEHEKETQELQQCWMELRHVVRCVYREAGTGLSENTLEQDAHLSALPDINKMKELVHRLSTRDPHQLYQRLESQGREYVIEMKVRLLKQLTSGHKTPLQAKQFVAMLLEEYSNLCTAAKTLASFLNELEQEHLKRFNLTWELHNKHMFQSIIYSDPVVQNSLPMLITQLRLGAASKESYHEDTYPNILHRYLKFDDEMSVISVVWRDCHQLLDEYNEEQATLKAKQKMLKEDWEFFKAQRKLLEKQVLKSKGGGNTQTHDFEAQFTETMRHILQGTKPVGDECHCPNCNRKRCSCDECTISHMITCGIISPEVAEQMPAHNPLAFPHDPSRYIIDVTPPSMSSTSSSSGSSSPITVDPERLTLPFDDCPENFELEDDDDIPEELEGDEQGDHFDDSNKSDHGSITEERNEQGGDEDVEEEEEDEEEEDYAEDDDDEEEDDDDDEEDEEDDEEEDDIDEDELLGQVEELGGENQLDGQALSQLALPLPLGPLIPQQNNSQKVESCDCTHCTQAKVEQAKQVEEASNQCQCHACLQQAGQGVATSLPQQLPTAPRPAALHLYPHIHGSNSLHTSPGMHNHAPHMRQVMQPHLYELHNGARPQGKNLLQQQKKHSTAYNLDLDSHEALHEHIHNAYGDWDNSYDATKLMLAPHKFGSSLSSELFSPVPPLMNGAQFVGDTLMSSADTSLASGLKSSGVLQHASLANLPVVNSQMTNTMTASNALLTTTTVAGTQGNEHVHTEACFKSMKAQSHALLNPVQSPTRQKVPMMPNVSSLASNSSVPMVLSNSMANNGGLIQTPHSDHCLKHNPFLHTHHSSFSSTHSTNTITSAPAVPTHPLPMKLTPELIRSAAISAGKDPVMGGVNMNPGAATPLNLPLTCNHAHMHNNQPITQLAGARNPQADLANAAGAGGAMNNVSVGTSTVCQDPDCDGHHEDDSVDDSCSEQSSSTSTSAQKDGKYCDCCYCEFFGHSNPPMAPTSRNYAEMRDRLRLRLKKKNEQKGSSVEPENIVVVEEEVPQPEEVEDQRGLDELIRFINGDEDDKNLEKLNAKAAKRARQKQRKAEEKARREAEERAQQLAEEQRRRAEEEAKRKLLNQETSKKKRGKHKDRKDNHLQVQKVHNNQLHSQNQTNLQQRRTSPTEGTSHNNKNGRQGNSAKVVNQCDIAKSESSQPNEGVNVNGGMQNPASRPRAKKENINATSSLKPDKSKKSNGKQPDSPKSPAPSLNRSSDGKGDTGNKASLSSQQPQASFTSRAQQQANQTHITPVNKQQHQNNNKTHTNNNTKNQQQPQTSSTQQQKITAQQQHIAAQQQIAAQNKQIAAQNKQIAAQNKQIAAEQHQAAVHQLLIKEHLAAQQVQAKKKNNKKSTQQQHQQHVQNQQLPNTQQRHQQYQNQHPASNPTVNQPGRQIRANLPQQDNHQQHQQINHVHMMNGSNQHHHQQEVRNGGPGMPREERRMAKPLSPRDAKEARSKASSEDRSPPKTNDQNSRGTAKSKRPKRKNKHADDLDEIFKPRVDLDLDNGDIDEFEREIEEFKRFCMDTKPGEKKERLQVNMNLKDIFQKKKSGVSCA